MTARATLPRASRALFIGLLLSPLLIYLAPVNAITGAGKVGYGTLTSPKAIASGELHEYPDVAVDPTGKAWVVWINYEQKHERIFLRTFTGTQGGVARDIGYSAGLQYWPRVIASGNKVWAVWCAKDDSIDDGGNWRVVARRVDHQGNGTIEVLSSSAESALRPSVGLDRAGQPYVAWESKMAGKFATRLRALDPAGEKRYSTLDVATDGELNLRPTIAAAPEGGVYVAWDHYRDGEYHVLARRVTETLFPVLRISDAPGINVGASATTDEFGRVFIAYATDVFSSGQRRIGKELRVRAIVNGTVGRLEGGDPPRLGTAVQRRDTVEFPTIVSDLGGRLWLSARRGQGFALMSYEDNNWQTPRDLSEKGWGGRGREIRMAVSRSGIHLVTRRLHLLSHQLLIPPQGRTEAVAVSLPREKKPETPENLRASTASRDTSIAPPVAVETDAPGWSDSDLIIPSTAGLINDPSAESGATARLASVAPAPPAPNHALDPSDAVTVVPDGVGSARTLLPTTNYPGFDNPEVGPLPTEHPAGVYFGDIHTHTWMSDGSGDLDEVYTRSRDVYRYDFVAVTDHDLENGNRILPSEWAYQRLMAQFFNSPQKFVTLLAYEWTSLAYPKGAGHRNVYFPGSEAPLLSVADVAPDSKTLFELLKDHGAIAIPHHIGWTGTDWENHDPEVQRSVEIVSTHGAFEKPGNRPVPPRAELRGMFVRDGLSRGLKFGLVGGSDGHGFAWHYGVSRKENVWRTGLTGVHAAVLNRMAIHAALFHRRSFATSGAAMSISFFVSGLAMGEEGILDGAPQIDIQVHGTAPLTEVALIRDGEDVITLPVSGTTLDRSLSDAPSPGNHYYYVRAVQENGEVAWTSPIWVELKGRILHGPPDP